MLTGFDGLAFAVHSHSFGAPEGPCLISVAGPMSPILGIRVTVCVTTHVVASVAETDHAVASEVEQIHSSLTITSHTFFACLFNYGFAVVVMFSNLCFSCVCWLWFRRCLGVCLRFFGFGQCFLNCKFWVCCLLHTNTHRATAHIAGFWSSYSRPRPA